MDSKFQNNMKKLLAVAEIKPAKGNDLDQLGLVYGTLRKRWLFGLFKESDKKYRRRLAETVMYLWSTKR